MTSQEFWNLWMNFPNLPLDSVLPVYSYFDADPWLWVLQSSIERRRRGNGGTAEDHQCDQQKRVKEDHTVVYVRKRESVCVCVCPRMKRVKCYSRQKNIMGRVKRLAHIMERKKARRKATQKQTSQPDKSWMIFFSSFWHLICNLRSI